MAHIDNLLHYSLKKKKKEKHFCDVGKAFRLAWAIYQKLTWEW